MGHVHLELVKKIKVRKYYIFIANYMESLQIIDKVIHYVRGGSLMSPEPSVGQPVPPRLHALCRFADPAWLSHSSALTG